MTKRQEIDDPKSCLNKGPDDRLKFVIDATESDRLLKVAREAERPAVKVTRKRQGGIADCACGETVFESMRYCPGCGAPLQWKDSI